MVGLGIFSGWIGTHPTAQFRFEDLRSVSTRFTAQMRTLMLYLKISIRGDVNFAIGSVLGVSDGALTGNLMGGHFRWRVAKIPASRRVKSFEQ